MPEMRNYSTIGILLVLLVLAWSSAVDSVAYTLNLDGLKETSAAFAILKSTTAVITTVENTVPLVGKLLSPYQNYLERMSIVMLVSFISLGLQKVIIIAMQTFIINAILSINVMLVVGNMYKKFLSVAAAEKLFKLLLILLFIRFSVPAMTVLIASIQGGSDVMMVEMQQERADELEKKLWRITEIEKEGEIEQREREEKAVVLNGRLESLVNQKETIESDIDVIRNEDKKLYDKAVSMFTDDSEKVKKRILPLQIKVVKLKEEIELVEGEIDENEEAISFGFGFSLTNMERISANLNKTMEDMLDVFLTSVTMFLFVNVVFPLLFLWGGAKLISKAFTSEVESKTMYLPNENTVS